jgi:hypothetical protein
VKALVDTGSEVNVMSEDMVSKLGLQMRPGPRVSVVMQTGEIVSCIGCCEDVPVAVKDIVTYVPMLVVPTGERDFILGRPWQHRAKLSIETQESGSVKARIFSSDRKRYIEFIAYAPTAEDIRTGRHVWSGPKCKHSKMSLN